MRLNFLPILAGGLLLALPAAAQKQPQKQKPDAGDVFVESIDVNVVNVDVVVTDASGRRVSGLTRNDFELREDGKPVEITNFYSEAGERSAAGGAGAALAEPVPEEQRLFLTIYFDNRNLTPPVRNRMLSALQRFVASKLQPDDRLVVASYDGALKIRQPPTNDPKVVSAVLQQVAKQVPRGIENARERRQLLADLAKGEPIPEQSDESRGDRQSARAGFSADQSERDAREVFAGIKLLSEAEYRQTRSALDTLGQLVDALSGLPGRKALLYVGGGLTQRPGETLIRAFLNKYPNMAQELHTDVFDSFQQDTATLFGKIIERANAQRVTFYTLGASTADSRVSGEWSENLAYSQDLEEIERSNHAIPLETLAAGTGGLVAFDPSDPGVLLASMREDLDTYYSLGYVPLHRDDGKNHKIEVLPKNPAFKVRHREGFRAQTQVERAASRTVSAMVFGIGHNPLGVNLGIEGETSDAKGNSVVSMLVMFPMSKLVLLPLKHVHQGRIRIFVGTRDEEGRNSAVTQLPVPIQVPNEQIATALAKTAAFRIKVAVRPGQQTIAVSVRDELGNSDSTALAQYKATRAKARRALRPGPQVPQPGFGTDPLGPVPGESGE